MTDRELLELIARLQEEQVRLLVEIRDQLIPTYPQPVAAGSSLTVRS